VVMLHSTLAAPSGTHLTRAVETIFIIATLASLAGLFLFAWWRSRREDAYGPHGKLGSGEWLLRVMVALAAAVTVTFLWIELHL
jgi:uncharacterized membrane protein YedE/YeeE